MHLKAEVGGRPYGWALRGAAVGLAMRFASLGECRNSCRAAAALAGNLGTDSAKVRGHSSGSADPTEMRRRCRDWNECDRRDCVLSDHARRGTDRSSLALARRQSHRAGYAMAPARIGDRNRWRLGGSSLNWDSRNRCLSNRHTLVHQK